MEEVLSVLLILMVITALAAVHMRSLLSAVIAMGAMGFGASAAFLLLGAPDVAIPQVVVDVVTVVILIRATVGRDVKTSEGTRGTHGVVFSVVLLLIFAGFAVRMVGSMPPLGRAGVFAQTDAPSADGIGRPANPDAPSHTYLAEGPQKTGAMNVVTAVLLDYRGYDTLGEATVLFAALLGAVALLRKRSRTGEAPEGGPQ